MLAHPFIRFPAQTPDHGINFDMSSVLKAPIGKIDGNVKPMGWFRTMIECNKEKAEEKPQNWPEISQGSILGVYHAAL